MHREGKIQLNNSLIGLTFTEGAAPNHDKFFVNNNNIEFADFFKLINNPKLIFWPKGKPFSDIPKAKFFFDIENIKMAISSFQGHAALGQLAYPSKVNDIDFISKIIICPLRKHMDLITGLIRSFRSNVLPRSIKSNIRDSIIKAEISNIWTFTEDQTSYFNNYFRGAPLPRGGANRFRGRRFGRGARPFTSTFRSRYTYPRDRFQQSRNVSFPYRRSGRQGGRRGGRMHGGQAAGNSEVTQNK